MSRVALGIGPRWRGAATVLRYLARMPTFHTVPHGFRRDLLVCRRRGHDWFRYSTGVGPLGFVGCKRCGRLEERALTVPPFS